MTYETFYDETKEINGVLRITIPKKLADFMGIKEGEKIKAMIKKVVNENESRNKNRNNIG